MRLGFISLFLGTIIIAIAIFTRLPRQTKLNPTPTPSPSPISYKTSCQTDSDCKLMNINDKNCCGSTDCEDKSTNNWIAVNQNWYSTFQLSCNDGPCPLAQCNPEMVRESFVARCVSNRCTKLGGL